MSPNPRKQPGVTHYRRATIRKTVAGTYQADISWAYQRFRRTFAADHLARNWIDTMLADLEANREPLTLLESSEARQAQAMLPEGVGLLDAARHYIRTHPQQRAIATVAKAFERFCADYVAAGVRPATLRSYRSRVGQLVAAYPDRDVDDLGVPDLTAILEGRDISALTRANYRRDWSVFFSWAITQGYLDRNPAEQMVTQRADDIVPAILSVSQTQTFLRAVETVAPSLAVYFALACFAGIRPAELARMDASAIAAEYVHVGAAAAKVRRQRYVSIEPTLRAWLDAYAPHGPVRPYTDSQFRDRFDAAKDVAGLTPWIPDYPRHSYASYHLARYQDAARTAHELGHTNTVVLFRHYRNLATAADAAAYFAILPAGGSS